jgi:hypothetical protein
VATAPTIPFDEDDLSNPLIARFIAMETQMPNVLDVRPEAEAELTKTVREIRLLLQDGDFTGAEPRVSALATRLQELLGGGQGAAPAATPASPTPTPVESSQPSPTVDNEALKLKLQEALNKLVPQLKQAVATYPDKKVELLTPFAQIKKQMDAGELQEAKAGILAVGQLLKSVMAQGTSTATPAQPEGDPRAEYERKLAALQPSYARALAEMLGDTGKFRAVMAYATEQAEAGGYGNAIKAIDRLATAVNAAIAAGGKETDVIEKGTVAARVAELEKFFQDRFAAAKNDTSNEVAKIENGIQDVPDENPAELVKEITDALHGLYDEAAEALVELLGSSDKSAILDEVANWRTRVSNDPLVVHVMTSKNKIGVDANVLNNFEQLFSEIETEVQKTEFVVV